MAATSHRAANVTVRPGNQRGVTNIGWLHSRHSFSFGRYFDPSNVGYRALRVINDDVVAPGGGFGEHGHDNMEILTWVLDGALRHGDSLGHMQRLTPGEPQVMTAGAGIRHSEMNDSRQEPVHFLQVWIEPATTDAKPRYEQRAFDASGRANRWQTLATGRAGDEAGGVAIDQDAAVRVADLAAGAELTLTVEPGRHA